MPDSYGLAVVVAAGVPLPPWMVVMLVGFLLISLLITFLKSPLFRGWLGELAVKLTLRFFLDRKRYHVINNVVIPAGEGTTQIDHLVVCRYGIFVIETKDYRGWIFGRAEEATWTQKFRRSSHDFQNPLRQNFKHVKSLAELLEMPETAFKSVIYFVGDAKLRTPLPENVLSGGLATYIKRHRSEVLSDEQVRLVLARIEENRLAPGLSTHVEHVRHVRHIVAAKERASEVPRTARQSAADSQPRADKESPAKPGLSGAAPASSGTPVCPKCGSPMVMRTSGRGDNRGKKFWGCSTFPRCRGIVSAGE